MGEKKASYFGFCKGKFSVLTSLCFCIMDFKFLAKEKSFNAIGSGAKKTAFLATSFSFLLMEFVVFGVCL